MNMNTILRRAFSFCLVLCLLAGCGGVSAFAAEDRNSPVEVKASSQNSSAAYGSVRAAISDALGQTSALSVTAEAGKSAEVEAASVEADGEFPTALFVCSGDAGSLSSVRVAGGVSASGEDSAIGVAVSTFDGGVAAVQVGGSVSAVSDEYSIGLHTSSFNGGTIRIDAAGDVAASGSNQARGIVLAAPTVGSETVTVNGNVSSRSSADAAAAEITLGDSSGGTVLLRVKGDLNCNSDAFLIRSDSAQPSATVVVEGTIRGEEVGVRVTDQDKLQNVRLVAWKIVRNRSGNVAETTGYTPAGELQKSVNYIVRTSAPVGAKLRIAGVSYQEDLGLYTAREGDEITLYVDLEAGMKLAGVYNGEKALEQTADGGFQLKVPRGGGIDLRVELG